MLRTNTKTIPFIRIPRLRKKTKDQKTVIGQQISPPSKIMRARNRFLMSRYDEVGKQVMPTSIPEPQ